MPKYTKSVRKSNMRKNKRGRSRRGGYWFYPSPGDDEHAFTKLRSNFSSGSWKFWQKQPEAVPDYTTSTEEPAPVASEPEQPSGSLEYPAPEPNQPEQMENQEAPMESQEAPMEEESVAPEPAPVEETAPTITGGRRRRRSRTTKKRKRSNMRRRTNKRRRSNKRRR
jgi:hypothetical protein